MMAHSFLLLLAFPLLVVCQQPDFSSMRVKELKSILWDRGQACPGCLEKQEFVHRCAAVYHMPVQAKPPPKQAKPTPKPTKTTLRSWVKRAERNVILPCMRTASAVFADTGATAGLEDNPHCWDEYWAFLAEEGLSEFDTKALQMMMNQGDEWEAHMRSSGKFSESELKMLDEVGGFDNRWRMTAQMSTAFAIVDALRHALGDEALEVTLTLTLTLTLILRPRPWP